MSDKAPPPPTTGGTTSAEGASVLDVPRAPSLADRLRARHSPKPPESLALDLDARIQEPDDDLGAFGWARGIKDRAIMLELRKRTGDVVAIGYSFIERIDFDPSEGITIHTLGKRISITGSNLSAEVRPGVSLLAGLCRHRVPWIQESPLNLAADGTLQLTSIDRIFGI